MKIILREAKTGKEQRATITKLLRKELPFKKDGWQFNWRELYKIEGANIFKITTDASPKIIDGILMLTIYNEEMVFMNNVEVAPHNYRRNGLYKEVAGCLIAYSCMESFERGKGNYNGFLSFDSKTELIELYQKKYHAKIAMGHKMYIDPVGGKMLMKKYLKID